MKKLISLLLVVVLTASLAVSGTLAYLTIDDVDSAQSNVFTVGDIDISLDEDVAVFGEGGEVKETEDGAEYIEVMPGDYLKKEVTVSNDGKTDAYVAVTVVLKNEDGTFANLLNDAIDNKYGDANAQGWYDNIFDGWGLNHGKDLDGDGTNEAGMRLTITGDDMPEYVLHVDSVKTIDEYTQFYSGNWFGEQSDVIPFDGYYTKDMGTYELKYTYYMLLPAGESSTLFNGLNVPAEFVKDQLAMFDGLKINVTAAAIQADNMAVADLYKSDVNGEAKTAFAILHGDIEVPEYTNKPMEFDTWDGTADTTWYNDTDTEFTLTAAEQLAGLAKLIDGGNTFEGKTVKLDKNQDLAGVVFEPIGSYRKNTPFKGTFDGQGHTIANMSQNTWALDNGYYYGDLGLGLFGAVENATIKNLTMDGASISGESAICGSVAACAYGECTFENITVTNSKVNDYQYYAGGVVGWASGDHTYKNINVDASTTVGSQWGDFGNANGGIIGGAGTSGTYHFEDCTVACRIDATNDVVSAYQWYNYRNSGMLIGQVGPETIENIVTKVTADNVTCKNVTVIYDDWANYTYCEFAGTGYPYVRVQAGVSVDAYSNVRYGHPTDANGNTVVDDNHVHNDGEAHHELIAFDNLFGGPANHRYCYYGISEHPGVTVIYNNK